MKASKPELLNTSHPDNMAKVAIRDSLPLTNQMMWKMAKIITEKQKAAKEKPTDKIDEVTILT
jgi:hypothetical protein